MSARLTAAMVRRSTVGSSVEKLQCGMCNMFAPQFTTPDGVDTDVDRIAAGWDWIGFALPAPPSGGGRLMPEALGFSPWGGL